MNQLIVSLLIFWPILSAFISLFFNKEDLSKDNFVIFSTLIELFLIIILYAINVNSFPIEVTWNYLPSIDLIFKIDNFRFIYALITIFMFFVSALFSREYFARAIKNMTRYDFFYLFTLGATVGVFISESLMTLFIFFEIMTFTSFVWVIHDESEYAQKAAMSYLYVGIFGGMAILIGLLIINNFLGTLTIESLPMALEAYTGDLKVIYLAVSLMVFGFAGKAGVFLLHFWLPMAHPIAPAPSSALLSGILTKTGIYGIIIVSSYLMLGNRTYGAVLLILGAFGMIVGAFRALLSINIKTTLALSSVSQIGFIVTGIGMQMFLDHHDAIAVRGIFMHMVNHSLLKLLLFNLAGLIYLKTHSLNLNEIRGFGRNKKWLALAFLVGLFSIGGFPLTSGFVSKTLLHESIVEQIWLFTDYNMYSLLFQILEGVFILSGGLTVAYMLKLFFCIFVENNNSNQKLHEHSEMNEYQLTSYLGVIVTAIPLIILGLFTDLFDSIVELAEPFLRGHALEHAVHYLAWINIKGALISILIGIIIFLFVVRPLLMVRDENDQSMYVDYFPGSLDITNFLYNPLVSKVLPFIGSLIGVSIGYFPKIIGPILIFLGATISNAVSKTPNLSGLVSMNLYNYIFSRYHEPLDVEPDVGYTPDEEVSGIDMIISSSLNFSLIQLAGGVVFVTSIILLLNYF